jgi:hypothetical protein
MELLIFNHYSIDRNSSNQEISIFFLDLVKGIHTYTKSNTSQLYTEIDNLSEYKLNNTGYTISDAIKKLNHRDLQLNILDLITSRCNHDCLNKLSENKQEQILNYEIYLKEEGDQAKDYILLAFTLENNAILLSFNRDIWTNFEIQGVKKENYIYTNITLHNIATEEHAMNIIRNKMIETLPYKNIKYTGAFMIWLKQQEFSHIKLIIEKIKFSMEHKLERRAGAIGKINSSKINNLYEIVVGSPQGMENAQIRVLFKDFNNITYFIYGFIKQNEYGISYEKLGHISNTLQIIKDEKLNEI